MAMIKVKYPAFTPTSKVGVVSLSPFSILSLTIDMIGGLVGNCNH